MGQAKEKERGITNGEIQRPTVADGRFRILQRGGKAKGCTRPTRKGVVRFRRGVHKGPRKLAARRQISG